MESLIILAVALFSYFFLKPLLLNDLNPEKAREKIRNGAVVIDVRSEDEYRTSPLKRAINIPLHEIRSLIVNHAPDRNSEVLLHCRTGSRSFVGKRILKKMDYKNVYNLGSFKRAKRILNNE